MERCYFINTVRRIRATCRWSHIGSLWCSTNETNNQMCCYDWLMKKYDVKRKVIALINNSWRWGRGTPLASFLLWGSHCHVRVMGHLSAVAQQLARRPLSKGTTVCFGLRWLQINKMDDTIWIRTWNTHALISFFPQWFTTALECDPPVDAGDTVFFSRIVIIQYSFTSAWHRAAQYMFPHTCWSDRIQAIATLLQF